MASPFLGRAIGGGNVPAQVADDTARAMALFLDPEHGVQIQQLKSGALTWLKATPLQPVLDQIARYASDNCVGVYFTINPTRPGSGASGGALTGDVVKRRWLYLDFDRNKTDDVTNKDNSATAQEKESCRVQMELVKVRLAEEWGWPAPIEVDSGNGYHLYYRIDLENDADAQKLVRETLKAVATLVEGDGATLDLAVHNANRISRIPGTWARKGPNTKDRPHSLCKLLHVPDHGEILTADQLRMFVADRLTSCKPEKIVAQPAPLAGPHNPFVGKASNGDGRSSDDAYVQAALKAEHKKLAEAPSGDRNNQLFKSAACMFEFVAAGKADAHTVEMMLKEACIINGLDEDPGCGAAGIEASIRSAQRTTANKPRTIPEKAAARAEQRAVQADVKAKAAEEAVLTTYPLPVLLGLELPEPRWAVPGLLCEGMTLLVGKPKLGKSWMALNLGITIAAGGLALGNIQTEQGDVLYLALEDRLRRIQGRARKVLPGLGVEASHRVSFATESPRLHEGGITAIEKWIKSVDRPTLVIIDVWAKFRPPGAKGNNAYEDDYRYAADLKSMADNYACSVLLVHHTRKGNGGDNGDFLEEVSGTNGLAGAADTTIVLQRSRGQTGAKLHITGRDVDERELDLEFSQDCCVWREIPDAADRSVGELQSAILRVLNTNRGNFLDASTIATAILPDGATVMEISKKTASVRPAMVKLEMRGEVKRQGSMAKWGLPLKQPPDDDESF